MSETYQQGIHTMPLTTYIADPAPEPSLSASVAHTLITESPIHAFMQHPRLNPNGRRDESSKADIGTIAHGLLLENDASRSVEIEADDWRTKVAKEARDAAYAARKVPILSKQVGPIKKMVEVAKSAIAQSELPSILKIGMAEQTLIWQEGDCWFRSRPDWLNLDTGLIVDYKTTAGSAEPKSWIRTALGNGNDLQAVLGLRGLRKLSCATHPQFIFMVQEQEPPYAVSFIGLDPSFLEMADHKLARAIALWSDCTFMNTWPGYPTRICWMAPPSWAYTEEEQQS